MKLSEKLLECQRQKKALLATNFYNFETLQGVLLAAKKANQPLILQLTQSSIDYMGLEVAIAMARAALKATAVEGWIHLDHGGSLNLVEQCLKAGVDSVMFDGSELPLEENIRQSAEAVKMARPYGANVEAELGYVAKLGQSQKMEYTDPEVAREFVAKTGVNALAVAIGTAHGFYKEEPKLDFPRLEKINQVAGACLVLHGSSGVPNDQLRRSIELGICKINLATEIKNIFMQTLQRQLSGSAEIDLRKVFPPATAAITELVSAKLRVIN